MHPMVNATDVRKHWSEFIDDIVRSKPSFVKRNRDILTILSLEQMESILDTFKFRLKVFKEDDSSFTGVLEELDLMANDMEFDQMFDTLFNDLLDYSKEYMDNFDFYYKSPNRKKHFPYIYKIITHENDPDKIKEDIELYRVEKNHA
ncbi:MAG: hypothetical protein Q7I98_08480 [Erysipelotrichaceae bacterium]|nr:hypothetical protein [Erysipelotrichaceae bacterium]